MPENNSNKDVGKKIAAEEALNFVLSEMVIGLGTGSTAKIFVDLLSQKYFKENLNIKVLATSSSTELQSKSLGLPITSIDTVNYVDLTIDGADEVDSDLNLLKGGGGALLQEKIVASYSKKMIVIVDNSKVVANLGEFPLPIEIVKFGSKCTQKQIENILLELGYSDFSINLRKENDDYFVTDEKHFILDLSLKKITDPYILDKKIKKVVGVVETGLFINMANSVIIGNNDGSFKLIEHKG